MVGQRKKNSSAVRRNVGATRRDSSANTRNNNRRKMRESWRAWSSLLKRQQVRYENRQFITNYCDNRIMVFRRNRRRSGNGRLVEETSRLEES